MRGERTVSCDDVRVRLLDLHRGRVTGAAEAAIRAHLAACAACARAEAVERELTALLDERLPQHPAPLALKRRLRARWSAADTERGWARWARWRRALAPALAVVAAIVVAVPLIYAERRASRAAAERAALVAEAVNDHLRVLTSQRPLEIESGGLHEVKPWFEGRLDFAPVVTFEGDAEFPLRGGAVGYFRDRKAAVFVYARRLHPISLFVFRADGLTWPDRHLTRIGAAGAYVASERGFNVVMWRRGSLGYALVSDVDRAELDRLAERLTRAGS
jgi:anti-sigma factor RsiW